MKYGYTDGNPVTDTDPSGLFTSVDFACLRDPQFCLEIMGQIIGDHGTIVARETGDQCLAEEANRVANGFRTAANVAGILQIARVGQSAVSLVRDATGKIHGSPLPSIGQLKNMSLEQIEESMEELRASILVRTQELEVLGEHGSHRARLAEEQALLRSLEKHLEDILGAKNR